MKEIQKRVSMKCSVCGNDQFSCVDEKIDLQDADDKTEVKCSDCGRITTKEQLMEDNRYIIDANIEDIKDEAIKQLEKELKKMFR